MFQLTKKITRDRISAILQDHKTDGKVLDVGASSDSYRDLFPNKVSIDIDEASKPDIVADAHDIPFDDNSFETVLCTEVLEHVKDPFRVVSELHRVLKKDGTLILTTRFLFPLHETPSDHWRFTRYGLEELFKDKWNIVKLETETVNFATLAVLLQRMGYQMRFKYFLDKPIKLILFVLARIVSHFNIFIKEEYGDIRRTKPEKGIFASGYYVIAKKKK